MNKCERCEKAGVGYYVLCFSCWYWFDYRLRNRMNKKDKKTHKQFGTSDYHGMIVSDNFRTKLVENGALARELKEQKENDDG